jgi:hypothetical protein
MHQVVFVQPVLSSRALPAVNSEVSWQMSRGLIGSVDVAPVLCQDDLKQLDGLRPGFFSPILPETHIVGVPTFFPSVFPAKKRARHV